MNGKRLKSALQGGNIGPCYDPLATGSGPLAKVNGFILAWESLAGVVSVQLLRSHVVRGSAFNQGG